MENQIAQADEYIIRDYQRNIIDVCIERNSIVFAPTGSGKTFICIQVMKHFSQNLEKLYSEGGKRSFFLVNTIFLAKQQKEAIENHVPYKVSVLTGEDNVDAFDEGKWIEILDENQILVMTAQCFRDAVSRTFIKLSCVNLIVFDECHHGRKDHVYHQIMQDFSCLSAAEMNKIRIIGLSGTLIGMESTIKPHGVHEAIAKLENTFQSTVITVNNIDDRKNVLIYSTKAKKSYITFTQTPVSDCMMRITAMFSEFQQMLEKITLDQNKNLNPKTLRITGPKKIKDLILQLKDFDYQVGEMGNFGAYLSLLSTLIQFELDKRYANTDKFRKCVQMCITKTEQFKKIMIEELHLRTDDFENIFKNSSNKVQKLILVLKNIFNDPAMKKDFQCIVFVQRRSTAKIVYHILKAIANCDKSFPIKPDFVVGQNNEMPESIEKVLSQSFSSVALDKFNRKETNCIVCTNVLEEGIDLQICNLVIMYDAPTTPRSYVQSCGRARDDESNYIIMLRQDNVAKFKTKESVWNSVDWEMKKELIGKTLDRLPPTEEEIKNEAQHSWEPFFTSSGSKLDALNAISILNQYCMTLPADKFTNASVGWRRIDSSEDGSVQVGITLPLNSAITNEILGDRKENVRLAKQHAAFEACKILYHAKNLTDKLTPVDSTQKLEEFNDQYFSHWDNYKNDEKGKAGTKNNRRYHQIKVPDVIQDCGPSTIKVNYLYRINITPNFDANNDHSLKVFHSMIGNENTFGILSSKRIPRLCKIPLFATFGQIDCDISPIPATISLDNESDLKRLRGFHKNLLSNVLKVFKEFFVIDKSSYLIVPLDEYNEINWNLVNTEIPIPKRLSYDQIVNMQFKAQDYSNKVINPVYRYTDQNYVVVNVLEHKSPLTAFPDASKAENYKEYYESKNEKIYRDDQFLVEVRGISKNLNLFFPGGGNYGDKKSKRILREEYVPELCHNYKFPGDYWLKATLLPSICHRIHYMLLSEEIRMWMIKEKIDLGHEEQIYQLDVDYNDFDERKEIFDMPDTGSELEKLENFDRVFKEQLKSETQMISSQSRALALQNNFEVPLDFDRNWLTVTEADIEYYCQFIGNKKSNPSSSSSILQKVSTSSVGQSLFSSVRSLKDSEKRAEIKLLRLTNLDGSVQQKDLIKVLTTAKSGDVFDMERFETLGDAFLKFIASLFLFKTHEKWHEGHLSALKGKLVSNRNLFYIGNEFGLSNMIKSSQFCTGEMLTGFAPSTTLPTNIAERLRDDKSLLTRLMDVTLSNEEIEAGVMNEAKLQVFNRERISINFMDDENGGEQSDNVNKGMIAYINENYVGDKIIADGVEALIGCVVSSIGINAASKLCVKLKILPQQTDLRNLLTQSIAPRTFIEDSKNIRVEYQSRLEEIIDYKFKNNLFLLQALTHPSYPIKTIGTYENLEFLGDAILDFLITSYISEHCSKKMDPGKLTDLRSALVNNTTLACIIVRNGIHKFLKSENCLLSEAIKKFVTFQTLQNHRVTDEIILLNTEAETSSAEAVDVPKVLGDIFESIIGAVFLDSNLCFTTTWRVIYNLMKNEIHEFMNNIPLQVVRRLYEFQKGSAQPKFYKTQILEETENVAVPLKFKCCGKELCFIGIGKNRKIAKNAVAKRALIELQKN